MSAITTHVLDTARGRPAAGIPVSLDRASEDGWQPLGRGVTDNEGRCTDLLGPDAELAEGSYRLRFAVGDYFRTTGVTAFYDRIAVELRVTQSGEHYHVPLLLSPFAYTTYRGS